MRVLVWQWGRFGAGPRFGACLAEALSGRSDIEVTLSLCEDAEILLGTQPPRCDLPVRTYQGPISFILRLATAPLALPFLLLRLRRIRPDLAICAMPGPLDVVMAVALRLLGSRLVVIVHDAELHPGDGFPMQMALQRMVCRCASGLAVMCGHVGARLQAHGLAGVGPRKLIPFQHPPFAFPMPAVHRTEGPPRLLCFGRLLPYKGLDLLAEALALLPRPPELRIRIVGSGPETQALDALRRCEFVQVENRWVPEPEIGALLAWADALVLPYREASQSGVAAAAIAAGRPVIATRVGGLPEQLASAPCALLCDPTAAGLAGAIGQWLAMPKPELAPHDAAALWRRAASDLLQAISGALPAKHQRPPGRSALKLKGWALRLAPRRS